MAGKKYPMTRNFTKSFLIITLTALTLLLVPKISSASTFIAQQQYANNEFTNSWGNSWFAFQVFYGMSGSLNTIKFRSDGTGMNAYFIDCGTSANTVALLKTCSDNGRTPDNFWGTFTGQGQYTDMTISTSTNIQLFPNHYYVLTIGKVGGTESSVYGSSVTFSGENQFFCPHSSSSCNPSAGNAYFVLEGSGGGVEWSNSNIFGSSTITSSTISSYFQVDCSNDSLFSSSSISAIGCYIQKGFFYTIGLLVMPPDFAQDYLKNSFTSFKTVIPFSLIYNTIDQASTSISSANASSSQDLAVSFPMVGNVTIVSSSTLENLVGTNTKNQIFTVLKSIIWIATLGGTIAIIF